jgi:integrase
VGAVNAAWAQFIAERSVALCPTTLTSDYTQVTKWLSRCPVQELDRGREVLAWVLQQEPRKSALRVGMYIKSFYKWASSQGVELVSSNPVATFRFPKKPQTDSEVIVISRKELPFLFAGLQRYNPSLARWDLVAEFMLQTGLRTGEAFAARYEDIDGERLLVHSNMTLTHGLKASTKTNKKRIVPLNAVAIRILEELGSGEGYLFPWNRVAFQSFFKDRVERLHRHKVVSRRYRPYDLRHTAISGWLEAGVPVAQIASWAGNTAEVIWKHYASTTYDHPMPVL